MKYHILIVITLIIASGFVNIASASNSDNDANVKEEIIGHSPDGKTLIKRVVSHPKENPAKLVANGKTSKDSCTKYFARWTITPVAYYLNPTNTKGLNWDGLIIAINESSETWDSAVSRELVDINGGSTPYGVADGKNSIVFGDNVANTGVIAQTIIWYYSGFRGQPGQIVEFDMTFEENFDWGLDGTPTVMDVQNIGTHEFGHAFGLSDLYTSTCSQQTMYGYSWVGDLGKRDLASGDLKGIRFLYP